MSRRTVPVTSQPVAGADDSYGTPQSLTGWFVLHFRSAVLGGGRCGDTTDYTPWLRPHRDPMTTSRFSRCSMTTPARSCWHAGSDVATRPAPPCLPKAIVLTV